MTEENGSKQSVNIGLIQRLFDQLEKAMSKVDDGMGSLSIAISEMLDVLKHSTSNDEIIAQIKDTNLKIEPTLGDVSKIHDKCKAHGEDVKSINTFLSKLSMWVRTMIIVVLVTFSLLTISYYFTRSSIESMVKSEFNSAELLRNTQSDITGEDYRSLKKQLGDIQKELKKHLVSDSL